MLGPHSWELTESLSHAGLSVAISKPDGVLKQRKRFRENACLDRPGPVQGTSHAHLAHSLRWLTLPTHKHPAGLTAASPAIPGVLSAPPPHQPVAGVCSGLHINTVGL